MLDPQARRCFMQQAMSPGQDSHISSIPAPPHQVSMRCSNLSALQESTASSTNACLTLTQASVRGTHPPPTSPATGTPAARQVSSTMSSRRRIPSSLRARRPRASSAWTSTPAAVRATGEPVIGKLLQAEERRARGQIRAFMVHPAQADADTHTMRMDISTWQQATHGRRRATGKTVPELSALALHALA